MSYTTTRRVARKPRRCGDGYAGCQRIEPGDVYLEHKEFPGGDAGYADAAGHPVRMAECAFCATRYRREHLLEPIPASFEDRYLAGIAQRGLL